MYKIMLQVMWVLKQLTLLDLNMTFSALRWIGDLSKVFPCLSKWLISKCAAWIFLSSMYCSCWVMTGLLLNKGRSVIKIWLWRCNFSTVLPIFKHNYLMCAVNFVRRISKVDVMFSWDASVPFRFGMLGSASMSELQIRWFSESQLPW